MPNKDTESSGMKPKTRSTRSASSGITSYFTRSPRQSTEPSRAVSVITDLASVAFAVPPNTACWEIVAQPHLATSLCPGRTVEIDLSGGKESAAHSSGSTSPIPTPPEVPLTPAAQIDDCVVDEESGALDLSDSRAHCKKRPRTTTADAPQRELHFFFKQGSSSRSGATRSRTAAIAAGAVAAVRSLASERSSKRRRSPAALVDPWAFRSMATVHVGSPIAAHLSAVEMCSPELLRIPTSTVSLDLSDLDWTPRSRREAEYGLVSCSCRRVAEGQTRDTRKLWSEEFRATGISSLDDVNRANVEKLSTWLSTFYADRRLQDVRDGEESADMASENSFCTESSEESYHSGNDRTFHFRKRGGPQTADFAEDEVENVALITGSVGCGKSTVIKQAADKLGLTILEVNALTCRTGRRIKDIVGEALATNRVHAGPRKAVSGDVKTQNSGFNTLIVFEEVDRLADDERGFWSCLAELSAAAHRRRPILMTANHLTPEMRAVFGDLKNDVHDELANLVSASIPDEFDVSLPRFKHIHVQSPKQKTIHAALRAVGRSKGVKMGKVLSRTIVGLHGSDMRGAINCLQFWSLDGLGTLASPNLIWPSAPEDVSELAMTQAMASFWALQSTRKMKMDGASGDMLCRWANAMDVLSDMDEGDVLSSSYDVEGCALQQLVEDFDVAEQPDDDVEATSSYFVSLASSSRRSLESLRHDFPVERTAAAPSRSFHFDTRPFLRKMAQSECASGERQTGRSRRATRSMAAYRPSSISRISDDALKALLPNRNDC